MPIRTPPFCPESTCEAHHRRPPTRWWVRNGTYSSSMHSRIQRYRCSLCGKHFSAQTFDIDYYAKRRVEYRKVVALVGSCCGIRQMARYLGVGYETVSNRIMRFARQAMAMQSALIDGHSIGEDLCADGLQSYWVSQYVAERAHRWALDAGGSVRRRATELLG